MTLIQKVIQDQLQDYKIVIVPHAELANKITEARKEFQEKYKIEKPITSRPDITLVTYKQAPASEQRIISHLKPIAMGAPAFKVEVKNYGSYPSHTIFLNVPTKLPLQAIRNQIRTEAGRFMKVDNDTKPHFIDDFHFTLGRKLAPWQYEQAWLEYSHRHFTGRFIADRMLFLRRKKGEYKYQILESFDFQNLAIETKQGELFG